MKEISVALCKRNVAICVYCASIFEGREWETTTCPVCKEMFALRWVTSSGSFLDKPRREKKPKEVDKCL